MKKKHYFFFSQHIKRIYLHFLKFFVNIKLLQKKTKG